MSIFGLFGSKAPELDKKTQGKLNALDRAMAVIEFDPEGIIQTANQNFLNVVGYTLDEIVGKHHRIFVDPAEAQSPAYADFWRTLQRGMFTASRYRRLGKGGKEIWIRASYNPILDAEGKTIGVVKYATDITEQRNATADIEGQVAAISRSQAVIEFTMSGEIIKANDNFLNAMGYRQEDIRGRHHRMFIEPEYAATQAYQDFWAALGRGEYQAAEFKRIGNGGKEVWILATYNPILNADGKPLKVVKFATDITARKRAINILNQSLQQLAAGDLSTNIDHELPDDLDQLRHAYNRSLQQLRDLVTQIQTVTSEVESAAAEITSGTCDLSERTEQAASNLEETAASMEEMAATVRQNADNAKNADQLANVANQTASKGGGVVERAVTAMSGIENSAQKITDIIGVIDEIAFQTNLLALNASVEAARAGEAGKGFAVVAQEVRQLAQRSAQAASDIKTLIQDSNSQVKDGVQLVNQAGEALGEIVGSIAKVTGIVQEISSASQEQASGVQEINGAINSMDEMTQQNSALVEESTAAARALSDQAGKLAELIAFFKLDGAAARVQHPSSAPRQPAKSTPDRPKAKVQRPAAKPAMAITNDEGWNEF
jgi:methyl-accepting chemotaxis protein